MQGYPIKEEERRKIIELHKAGYFPSVIARYLSSHYSDLNGGSRDEKTIRRTIQHYEMMGEAGSMELPDLSPESEPKPPEQPEPVELPKPAAKAKAPDMRSGNGRRKARA